MKIKMSLLVCGLIYSIVGFTSSMGEAESIDMLVINNLDTQNMTSFSLIRNDGSLENIILKPKEQCYVNESKFLPKTSNEQTTVKLTDGSEVVIKRDNNLVRKLFLNQIAMTNNQARFYIQQDDLNSWMAVTDSQLKPQGVDFIPRHVFNEGKNIGYLLGISSDGKTETEIHSRSVKDSHVGSVFSCEDKASGFGNALNGNTKSSLTKASNSVQPFWL